MIERIASGRPIAHVAAEMGVARKTADKWWRRWVAEGDPGLEKSLVEFVRVSSKRRGEHLAHLAEGLRVRRSADRRLARVGDRAPDDQGTDRRGHRTRRGALAA